MSGDEKKAFLFVWKIEHLNFFGKIYCECLSSPAFKVESLENSEWKIHLFPRTISEDLECRLERQNVNGEINSKNDTLDVNFQYQLASSTGVILKTSDTFRQAFEEGSSSDIYRLIELYDLIKEVLKYPEDSLIFRCYLSHNPVTSRDTFMTGCEVETDISCHTPSYIWSLKFSNHDGWSVSKQIKLDNIPIEIIFKYVNGNIRIELISNVEDDWTHHFTCDIELINAIGNEVVRGEGDYEYAKENKNWEFPIFISKQHLEQARCFARKEIRIKFYILRLYSFISKINYSKEFDLSKNEIAISNSESQSSTSSDTNCLLYYSQYHFQNESFEKTSADLKLRVDNELFNVHKTLLSELSTVFSEMFLQSIEKNNTDIIDFNDMEADTLKYFLEYVYNGTLKEMDDEIALDLLVAAERYQVLPLVTECSKHLEENLSVTNVCRVLYIADMINHMCLKSKAVEYIVVNAPEILAKSEWSYWIERNVHLATEVFLKLSKKLETGLKPNQDLQR